MVPVDVMQFIGDWNRDEPSPSRAAWLGHDPLRTPLPNPLVWTCSVEMVDKAYLPPEWLLRKVGRFAENR